MFHIFKKHIQPFRNFGTGEIIPITEAPDEMFASKMLGDGYALMPSDGKICAPVDGEVVMTYPTGHAYGIKAANGSEILIHLGIDTVEMDGRGFESLVLAGQTVKAGDPIAFMDIEEIQRAGKSAMCFLIFTSGDKIELLRAHEEVDQNTTKIFRVL